MVLEAVLNRESLNDAFGSLATVKVECTVLVKLVSSDVDDAGGRSVLALDRDRLTTEIMDAV